MRLYYPLLSEPMLFEENKINVLTLENNKEYFKLVKNLLNQIETDDGEFILSKNYDEILLSKNCFVITDLFSIKFNDKKILNLIYKSLSKISNNEENYIETINTIEKFVSYFKDICNESPYDLSVNDEFDVVEIFKMLGIKINAKQEELTEKIIDYLSLIVELKGNVLFVFVNLKCFLNEEDLKDFYNEIFLRKINVLLLENHSSSSLKEYEKNIVIDNDLCEIIY